MANETIICNVIDKDNISSHVEHYLATITGFLVAIFTIVGAYLEHKRRIHLQMRDRASAVQNAIQNSPQNEHDNGNINKLINV